MHHQACGDIGGVDGGVGCATAGLGSLFREECGGVVLSRWKVTSNENSEGLPQHAAISEEFIGVLDMSPDGAAGGDGVDAAEDYWVDGLCGTVTIVDAADFDRRIDQF